MKKQNTLTITKEDFIQYLASQGVKVPDRAYWHGGNEEWDCHWPIIIDWDEPLNASVIYAHDFEQAKLMVQSGEWIQAVKYIRNQYGWGLKEAKDYYDMYLKGFRPQ